MVIFKKSILFLMSLIILVILTLACESRVTTPSSIQVNSFLTQTSFQSITFATQTAIEVINKTYPPPTITPKVTKTPNATQVWNWLSFGTSPNNMDTLSESSDLEYPSPPETYPDPHVIEEKVNQLRQGLMAFNPPQKMKQAEVVRIVLRIAPIGLAEDIASEPTQTAVAFNLTTNIEGPGDPVVEDLDKVGTVMKAKLVGDGFEVTSLSEEEQFVAFDTYTEWAWNVMPKKSGEREINLTVTVKVIVEGLGERARDIPVISRTVIVQVNPVYTFTSFVGDYWQWLWAAILLPVAGWLVAYFSKKRAEKQKKVEKSNRYFE